MDSSSNINDLKLHDDFFTLGSARTKLRWVPLASVTYMIGMTSGNTVWEMDHCTLNLAYQNKLSMYLSC